MSEYQRGPTQRQQILSNLRRLTQAKMRYQENIRMMAAQRAREYTDEMNKRAEQARADAHGSMIGDIAKGSIAGGITGLTAGLMSGNPYGPIIGAGAGIVGGGIMGGVGHASGSQGFVNQVALPAAMQGAMMYGMGKAMGGGAQVTPDVAGATGAATAGTPVSQSASAISGEAMPSRWLRGRPLPSMGPQEMEAMRRMSKYNSGSM